MIISIFLSCDSPTGVPEPEDTPTSGKVSVMVDESYQLLFDSQISIFESLYKNADIRVAYAPESGLLKYLLDDSCKVIVRSYGLSAEEKKIFEAKNLYPRSVKVARDAVAFILHPENTDTAFTVEEIRSMLMGKDTLWPQLSPGSKRGRINVVFDNPGSANARYMKEHVLEGKDFSANCFAVNSNPEVIEYVKENKNAVGVLSVNWVSDRDDSLSQRFLKEIKIAGIQKDPGAYPYKPYQAYIATEEYPFCRDVYMINRQTRAGLGTGFVSFVAGDQGQRIILKSGLVPAIAPTRMVQIKD